MYNAVGSFIRSLSRARAPKNNFSNITNYCITLQKTEATLFSLYNEKKWRFKFKKQKKSNSIPITRENIQHNDIVYFKMINNLIIDEMLRFFFLKCYELRRSFKKIAKKTRKVFKKKLNKMVTSIKQYKQQRQKQLKLIFLNTKFLYILSVKQLHLEKKRILLLNTKKTANNFWGWIRTSIIYFIPKMYNKLKNYFYNFKIELKKIKDMQNAVQILAQNKEETESNQQRILRKEKWFKEQRKLQRVQKEKYKLQKQYNIQQQEYSRFLIKKANLENQRTKINAGYTRDNPQTSLWNTLHRIMIITVKKYYAAFYTFIKPATMLPQKQYITQRAPETLASYMKNIKTLFVGTLKGFALRSYQESQRIIQRRYVEPELFKKLKQQYKRDRKGLFEKITQILTERESKKHKQLFLIKACEDTYERTLGLWDVAYIRFLNNTVFAPKIKSKYTNVVIMPYKLVKYNLNLFFTNLLTLIMHQNRNVRGIISKTTDAIRDYSKINFMELKRILSNA